MDTLPLGLSLPSSAFGVLPLLFPAGRARDMETLTPVVCLMNKHLSSLPGQYCKPRESCRRGPWSQEKADPPTAIGNSAALAPEHVLQAHR